jgi:hypothetical protein
MLHRVFRMIGGVNVVTVREVRVVSGFFVVAGLVVLGGFMVVARSVFQMLRCLLVMIGCFVRHGFPPDDLKTGLLEPKRIIESRSQDSGEWPANWG